MAQHPGNLSDTERVLSALMGLSLSVLALRRGSPTLRAINGAVGTALLARAVAGHCGVKAALAGRSSLGRGMADQWHRMRGTGIELAVGESEPSKSAGTEDPVDTAVNDSFPASDPPGSRLPDEPPSNAADKWEAARTRSDT